MASASIKLNSKAENNHQVSVENPGGQTHSHKYSLSCWVALVQINVAYDNLVAEIIRGTEHLMQSHRFSVITPWAFMDVPVNWTKAGSLDRSVCGSNQSRLCRLSNLLEMTPGNCKTGFQFYCLPDQLDFLGPRTHSLLSKKTISY